MSTAVDTSPAAVLNELGYDARTVALPDRWYGLAIRDTKVSRSNPITAKLTGEPGLGAVRSRPSGLSTRVATRAANVWPDARAITESSNENRSPLYRKREPGTPSDVCDIKCL